MNNAAASKKGSRTHFQERVRQTKDRAHNDVNGAPTRLLDVSCQTVAATSSSKTQESEEMPIYGYFTLNTVASKVMYCLTFSQELLQHLAPRQYRAADLSTPQSTASVADANSEWEIHQIIGQKMIGRKKHYLMEWKNTWMAESELTGAKGLVDAFMAKGKIGSGSGKQPLKRGRPTPGPLDPPHKDKLKRQRR